MQVQFILAGLSVLSSLIGGWLALRVQDAKHDREYKFRTLELQMSAAHGETIDAVRKVNGQGGR